ncbi:MAG TPA: GNAT family N-acetyltransferase, partial [Acidimicrobiales bacterium]|nr:GNAT family N-acetyltransferase [Acidimicrobiales bacterium]
VVVNGDVAGAVRLKAGTKSGCFETGAWLCRSARGRGIGRQAMEAVIKQAAIAGAKEVYAETTTSNHGALAVLRHLGFHMEPTDIRASPVVGRPDGNVVRARLRLGP